MDTVMQVTSIMFNANGHFYARMDTCMQVTSIMFNANGHCYASDINHV